MFSVFIFVLISPRRHKGHKARAAHGSASTINFQVWSMAEYGHVTDMPLRPFSSVSLRLCVRLCFSFFIPSHLCAFALKLLSFYGMTR
jgi:hypothetical protein